MVILLFELYMLKFYEIKAVHEKNLEKMLDDLDLLDDVKKGNISCKFCNKTITLENLQCIYPKNEEIFFCCDDLKCFEKAIEDSKAE